MPTINSNTPMQFTTDEQAETLREYTSQSYVCHVACHELLGHGTGKLLYRKEDGSSWSHTDPITGEEYESCYEAGDTWNTRFGAFSSSYEECRADTVGFYLESLKDVQTLFGFTEDNQKKMMWTNVMSQLRKGILGLPL